MKEIIYVPTICLINDSIKSSPSVENPTCSYTILATNGANSHSLDLSAFRPFQLSGTYTIGHLKYILLLTGGYIGGAMALW